MAKKISIDTKDIPEEDMESIVSFLIDRKEEIETEFEESAEMAGWSDTLVDSLQLLIEKFEDAM